MIQVRLKSGELISLIKYDLYYEKIKYYDSKNRKCCGVVDDIQPQYFPLKIKIKSLDEILSMLDRDNKTAGVTFNKQTMTKYCDTIQEVQQIFLFNGQQEYIIDYQWYFIEDWIDWTASNNLIKFSRTDLKINNNRIELEEGLFR